MGVYNIEPKAHKDIVSSIWPEFQPILHQDSRGDSFHFNNFPVNLSYKSQLSILKYRDNSAGYHSVTDGHDFKPFYFILESFINL